MLRTKAVEAGTLDLIRKFMSDTRFDDFNLVGGTALALKIGHHLTTTYNATKVRTLTNVGNLLVGAITRSLRAKVSRPKRFFGQTLVNTLWRH